MADAKEATATAEAEVSEEAEEEMTVAYVVERLSKVLDRDPNATIRISNAQGGNLTTCAQIMRILDDDDNIVAVFQPTSRERKSTKEKREANGETKATAPTAEATAVKTAGKAAA